MESFSAFVSEAFCKQQIETVISFKVSMWRRLVHTGLLKSLTLEAFLCYY